MRSKETKKLDGGRYRETRVWDNGAKTTTVYKPGPIFRKVESVKHEKPPKRSR